MDDTETRKIGRYVRIYDDAGVDIELVGRVEDITRFSNPYWSDEYEVRIYDDLQTFRYTLSSLRFMDDEEGLVLWTTQRLER